MTDGEDFQRVSVSTPLHRLSMIIEQTATLLCQLPGEYHKIVLLRQNRDEDNGEAQFAIATRKRAVPLAYIRRVHGPPPKRS